MRTIKLLCLALASVACFNTVAQEIVTPAEYKALLSQAGINMDDYTIVSNAIPAQHPNIQSSAGRECFDFLPLENPEFGGIGDEQQFDIDFGFDFEFFGTTYNSCTVSDNGYIGFDAQDNYFLNNWDYCQGSDGAGAGVFNVGDFLFPYWADINPNPNDEEENHVQYAVFEDFVVVTWKTIVRYIPQGGFNDAINADETVTFSAILTSCDSGVLPDGNSVAYVYGAMNWTSGNFNDNAGACVSQSIFGQHQGIPALVGYNDIGGEGSYVFGYFGDGNGFYYGEGSGFIGSEVDNGSGWLTGKTLLFNTCAAPADGNLPPVTAGDQNDCVIDICQGASYPVNVAFTGPENNQQVEVVISGSPELDLSGIDLSYWNLDQGGNNANLLGSIPTGELPEGMYDVTFTVTDNGSPAQTTVVTYTLNVLDIAVPELSVMGESLVCSSTGNATALLYAGISDPDALPGYSNFIWSAECYLGTGGDSCAVAGSGLYTVTATFGACEVTSPPFEVTSGIPVNPLELPVTVPDGLCAGEEGLAELALESEATNSGEIIEWTSWSVYNDYTIPNTEPLGIPVAENQGSNEFLLVPGEYTALWISDQIEDNCPRTRNFKIDALDVFIPEDYTELLCDPEDEIDPSVFEGGYMLREEVQFSVRLQHDDDQAWFQAGVTVEVNGVVALQNQTNIPLNNVNALPAGPINGTVYNTDVKLFDNVTVTYNNPDGVDTPHTLFIKSNQCGVDEIEINMDTITDGMVVFDEILFNCPYTEPYGQWEVTGPEGATFMPVDSFATTFTPASWGEYNLTFTDGLCDVEYPFDIVVSNDISFSIDPDDYVCSGSDIAATLSPDAPNDYILTWDAAEGADQAGLGLTYTPDVAASSSMMTINLVNPCSTQNEEIWVIGDEYVPSFDDFCIGAGTTLDVGDFGIIPGQIINWSATFEDGGLASGAGGTFDLNETATVTVTINNECWTPPATYTELVTGYENAELQVSGDFIICDGEGNETNIVAVSTAPGASQPTWTGPNGETLAGGATLVTSEAGQYTVTANSTCGPDTETITVEFPAPISMSIASIPDSVLCPNEFQTLQTVLENPVDDAIYSWSYNYFDEETGMEVVIPFDTDTENFEASSAQLAIGALEQVVIFQADVMNNCSQATSTIPLFVTDCAVIQPNVFTPDDDSGCEGSQYANGCNNAFYLPGLEAYYSTRPALHVYNRWGVLVYSNDNYKNEDPWTGIGSNGQELPEGVYFYTVTAEIEDWKGHVTILR